MAIRSAAKAIIVQDGKILLDRCRNDLGQAYYDLPGGGQRPYETMEQAVCREILEETGYTARVLRFAALAEEICGGKELRERFPDYTHRIHHIFMAELTNAPRQRPSELDWDMEDAVWLPVSQAAGVDLRPKGLGQRLPEILEGAAPVYLGASFLSR